MRWKLNWINISDLSLRKVIIINSKMATGIDNPTSFKGLISTVKDGDIFVGWLYVLSGRHDVFSSLDTSHLS